MKAIWRGVNNPTNGLIEGKEYDILGIGCAGQMFGVVDETGEGYLYLAKDFEITEGGIDEFVNKPNVDNDSGTPTIRNSREGGNDIFVFGPRTKDSHIGVVVLDCEHPEPVMGLLGLPTDGSISFGCDKISNKDGREFLMWYNPQHSIPYPIVAVSRFVAEENGDMLLVDVTQEDLDVVTHVRKAFMTNRTPS